MRECIVHQTLAFLSSLPDPLLCVSVYLCCLSLSLSCPLPFLCPSASPCVNSDLSFCCQKTYFRQSRVIMVAVLHLQTEADEQPDRNDQDQRRADQRSLGTLVHCSETQERNKATAARFFPYACGVVEGRATVALLRLSTRKRASRAWIARQRPRSPPTHTLPRTPTPSIKTR